jgi:N-acetyl-alpha-D-muramate 1-phosphate uridylyltransferase
MTVWHRGDHQLQTSETMSDHPGRHGLVGLALAAGRGSRLVPLTRERPKPLCPVGDVTLVDLALDRLATVGDHLDALAVNMHHGAPAMLDHLSTRTGSRGAGMQIIDPAQPIEEGLAAHPGGLWVSHEVDGARGTAGAISHLSTWLNGRGVLVVNADTATDAPLSALVDGWDGRAPRLLLVGGPFGPRARVAGALVPWSEVQALVAQTPHHTVTGGQVAPVGLFEASWSRHARAGTLDQVVVDARFTDCGTPADYLAANLHASGGASVVGEGAVVAGTVDRCVVWPGARVEAGEHLVDAVRTTAGRTVLVRS